MTVSAADASSLPVFVHGMWRTGSTYIWKKFREQTGYRAFLEPFHELLLHEKEEDLRRTLPPETARTSRHPDLTDYYFAEYEFEGNGGVRHFEKRFSYESYCLKPESSDPVLRQYMLSLIELAMHNHQRPVFKFTRGLMRAGWLRAAFPSHTILLLRRPLDLWRSFSSFANPYFLVAMCMLVGQNRNDEIIGEIARRHQVPFHISATYEEDSRFYQAYVASRSGELYPILFDLHLLTTVSAARYADVVIDVNAVSTSPRSSAFVTSSLLNCGVQMIFDDCKIPSYPASEEVDGRWADYERSARSALREILVSRLCIPSEKLAMFAPGLSRYSLELLEEWVKPRIDQRGAQPA